MSRDGAALPPLRCLLVAAGATGAASLPATWLLPHLLRQLHHGVTGLGFETLLVTAAEAAVVVCAGWLWFLVLLVLRDAVGERRDPRSGRVPTVVRRWVLAACGLSLAGGLLGPAHAAPAGEPQPVTAEVLAGLAVPDRTTAAPGLGRATTPPSHAARASRRAAPRVAVVAPGDTLWAVAARTLPPGAAVTVVDRRWREIYRANRGRIGPDPDLIRPGQRLRLPDGHT